MLDGGVPELELGAILIALRVKSESLPELLGFYNALSERLFRLRAPAGKAMPIVLPSYNGARHQPNLLPLLALLLQRFGVPVLIHGPLTGNGRIATAYILRELGVMPCASLGPGPGGPRRGRHRLVPTAALAPGLTDLLSLRASPGRAHDRPFAGEAARPVRTDSLRLVSVSHPPYLDLLREFLLATGAHALLLRSTQGDPLRSEAPAAHRTFP